MTEIEDLINEIKRNRNYFTTMEIVTGEIKGFSFFPGGKGTYYDSEESPDKSEKISDKEYMILGHDWGTLSYYNKDMNKPESKKDPTDPTCRNLKNLLEQVNIKPENCFFTNAILGVRKDIKITAKPPAFEKENEEFLRYCRDFFKKQVSIQRPKVIFVLGRYPAKFLAPILAPLNDKTKVWGKFPNFKTIDEQGAQVIKNVEILPNLFVNFVLLVHPSWSHVTSKGRTYKTYQGPKAEIEMIKEAMK